MKIREESLARIAPGAVFDVLVIGGGVNGVAVMRELALNGVSALLVDRSDFCKGASGASSRMAHGGLRYLENREFKLVAESTRERNRLLKYAPHFTSPLEMVVPLTSYVDGLAGSIRRFIGLRSSRNLLSVAGLKGALYLYEFLGRVERVLPSHRTMLSRARFPQALAGRYKAVITYFDARIRNPEALVLEMIDDAMSSSQTAAFLNYATAALEADGNVSVVDSVSGLVVRFRPRLIINAGGAWIDAVNQSLGLKTRYIRPVKGAHLLIRHDQLFRRMAGRAFYFDDGTGRMVIAYPLDRTVLLGTTEIQVDSPDDASIAPAEIDYLIRSMSSLFDDIEVTEAHIAAVTTGIRPLQSGGSGSANQANRDHLIAEDRVANGSLPVLSLVGGKWTTFRSFGEQVADHAFRLLGTTRRADTRKRPYPGAVALSAARGAADEFQSALVGEYGISHDRAENLVRRYGGIAAGVAAYCAEAGDTPIKSLPDYTEREVLWLVNHRAAVTLADLLLRRTQIVLDGGCTEPVIRDLAHAMARAGRGDAAWADREIARCLKDPMILAGRSASQVAEEVVHG